MFWRSLVHGLGQVESETLRDTRREIWHLGLKQMMTEAVGPAQRNMDTGTEEPPNLLLPMFILLGETPICLVTRQATEVILDSSPPHLTSQASSLLLSKYSQSLPLPVCLHYHSHPLPQTTGNNPVLGASVLHHAV